MLGEHCYGCWANKLYLFLGKALGNAVKHHRQQDDRQSADGCQTDFQGIQALNNRVAESTGADQGCNDNHRQGHHQGLIQPGHDRGQSQGKLDFT